MTFAEWKSEQYKDQSTEEKFEFVEHLHNFPEHFKKAYEAGEESGYKKALEQCAEKFAESNRKWQEVLEKANEWHYPSKGELPKDNSFVLVWTIDGGITTNYGKEYSDGIPENGLFQGIHISDVIAWKEIIPPKESE